MDRETEAHGATVRNSGLSWVSGSITVCRTSPDDGVWVITGPGRRGMPLGPALAEQSADIIEL